MKSSEIRQAFLDYFNENHHEIVPSSPLVPADDPTLLFTNAGMVQFKETFLGLEKRPYQRATSAQRCVRAGGKHNDLENVGYTARHHTFFEMLGNFSFGDYFKREAIHYAWNFLTKVLKIPAARLWVTVYHEDDEAADIWLKELKIDPNRFTRQGEKDNFWSMGDTGPCGPCTEIFYDHGSNIPGGPPGSPDQDLDRYIEIWNLVFMQFNRDISGKLTPLPKPSVDTGMGLERISAVMQGVHDNYEIDSFQNLLKAITSLSGVTDFHNKSMRVIADHIRSCSFLIVDGVMPSNEGRGYVLRRIIRRAIRHGHKLGLTDTFFYKLVAPLAREMGDAYPELIERQKIVEKVLRQEEEQFVKTLDLGLKILEQDIARLKVHTIPGETIFRLYDTYGFPVDLTGDIARERGLELDIVGFEQAMQGQRERSQAKSQFKIEYSVPLIVEGESIFTGYEHLQHKAKVTGLFRDAEAVNELSEGEIGAVLLDQTPFYAEGGGQVGDKGWFLNGSNKFQVSDTRKVGQVHLHYGEVTHGKIVLGSELSAEVDQGMRRATMLNHSATHLLHAALRKILGDEVTQKGSLVDPTRLRFDFSHNRALTPTELREIERLVNEQIRSNLVGDVSVMTPDNAKKSGAMALFGEKYGEKVRVVRFGNFSQELCGGTHVDHTGDIGLFKIISETGVAAGIRRIEAITGDAALDWLFNAEASLDNLAGLLNSRRENIAEKIQQLVSQNRDLVKELAKLKAKLAVTAGSDLATLAIDVGGVKVIAHQLEGVGADGLRETLDQLKQKLKMAVIVLAIVVDNRVNLIAGVTKNCLDRFNAGELVNFIASQVGGKGGGRADMAQAGGDQPEKLTSALQSVTAWVQDRLNKTSK